MPNETPRKRRILPWIITGGAALLLFSLAFVLFTPLDLTRYAPRIESLIETSVTGDVALGSIVIKALPSPDIEVTEIALSHAGKKLFSADRVRVRLSLAQLLAGKAVFQALELKNPDLALSRDKDGRFNISLFLESQKQRGEKKEERPSKAEEEEEYEGKRKLIIKTLDLRGGHVIFIDDLPAAGASFELSGLNAMFERTGEGHTFGAEGMLLPSTSLAFSGKVDNTGIITGHGSVEGLMLSRFNPYIQERSHGASVEGRVDLDLSYLYNDEDELSADITYKGLQAALPSIFNRPISSPSGQATLKISYGKEFDLSADDIKVDMEGFTVKGRLGLSGGKDERRVSIRASTTPISLATVKALIPLKAIPNATAEKLIAIEPLGGSIAIKELSLDGKAEELKGGAIFKRPGGVRLAASINGASFGYKGLNKPFENISAELAFSGNELAVSNFSGKYGNETIRSLNGRVRDALGKATFDLSIQGSLDIGETLSIARDLSEEGAREKLAQIDASGSADINASLSGALKEKKPLKYSGETLITGAAFSYGNVPEVDSLNARVSFDNELIRVHESKALVGQSDISLSGTVEGYRGKDARFSLKASGGLTEDILRKIARKEPPELKISERIPFTVTANGRPDDFAARGSLDATSSELFLRKNLDKSAGFPLKAEVDVERKGAQVIIKDALVDFGSSSVKVSGNILTNRKAYSLSLASDKILIADIDEVSPFLRKEFASSGAVSLNIKAGKAGPEAKPEYQGSVGIKDGSFKTKNIPNPIEKVNARATLDREKATIDIENISTGSTSLNGRINVLDIAERDVTFDLFFPTLHITDLLKKKEKEKNTEEDEATEEKETEEARKEARKIKGTGTIKAAEGDLWGHRFTALSTGVLMDGKIVQFYPLAANIDGGTAAGSYTLFISKSEPLRYTVDMKLTDIDLETALSSFRTKKRVLSGKARVDILLSSARDVKPAARGLNGYMNISTGKGRLWKFGFLTDIFSIVNIVSIDELFEEGLRHKGIDGNFMMVDGVLSTDNLSLDSDTLRMSAVGEIDTSGPSIDATIALHPFVTIDKIISNIPLAGWIITGDRNSAVSLYFEMEGPLKDPDVLPLPVKSIRKNIFGILERLIRTPFRLFE
ncbi:MAG TPA: hypothetical protein DDW94_09400 [Deltaproteobacteria bacterium]|nr:MAG: hypothetical protein A2Z79_03895 [Deltaproteobacteria bacterium GWA2_55_82]OGQ64073.1 MAG: hypothetical protein A3I81_10270 [Deltaproteobacteria bacterium RIFCSPLOWO2_02_FULL_55_12]OIJ74523.1 MAG: hypothetical protein A2V21_309795 [Deltaproteobacteria bacterium GWC2_55_46]HBG47186.1 hypothetical protein [Deltaproteobacteria bacterium]HCY10752.1 hypothetical protein [Deltaproteobacteria bacterium]